MAYWRTYLKLETKKGMKFIPFFLMSILFAAGAVVLAAVLFCAVMDRRQLFPKAEIAIVLNSDGSDDTVESEGLGDIRTGMMIGVVENMESVKSVCHFEYMSPKAAAEGLADGSVDAAVYLPKGVYDDINTGANTPVLVRLSARSAALQGDVFRQLTADGVSLIRTVETAIYAVDRVSLRAEAATSAAAAAGSPAGAADNTVEPGGETFQLTTTLADAEDRLFRLYVACALGRTSIFSSSSVSAFGNLTMLQFYAVTALLLILLLFGIGFSAFYNEGERDTARTLRRLGLHPAAADAAKVLAVSAVLSVLLLILFFLYELVSQLIPGSGMTAEQILPQMPRILSDSAASLIRSIPLIAAAAFSLAAAVHLLYTFAPAENSELFYLLVIAALFVLSGGLLPLSWMPQALRAAAAWSPVQVWQGTLAGLLFGAEAGATAASSAKAVLHPLLTGLALLVPACLYQIAADILASSRPPGEDAAQPAGGSDKPQAAHKAASEPRRTYGGSSRWLLRLRVLLARQLRSPAFWFVASLLLVLQIVLGTLALPAADNSSIGIVNGGGRCAKEVTSGLLDSGGAYSWIPYENADALRAAVASGAVDSGFVLDQRLDEAIESDSGEQAGDTGVQLPELSNCIDYISSTSSTKGEAAKEDVFACLLAYLSPELLSRALDAGVIFENPNEEMKAVILDEMQTVLEEDTLFDVRFETFPADDGAAGLPAGLSDSARSEAGLTGTASSAAPNASSSVAGVLLFAALLLFAAAKFRRSNASVIAYFRREGFLFQTMEIFAPLLPVGLLFGVALAVVRAADAPFSAAGIAGFLLLIPALFLAAVWAALFTRLFRHVTVYLFLSVALILLAAALSPAAGGISFLSSIRWVRYLLPASWFMGLL